MASFRLPGFTRLDALDIQKRFPDATITFGERDSSDARHGELGTVAIVVITLAGLQAVAAWLLKSRKENVIERRIEVVGADGSRRLETLRIKLSDSSAPEAEVVKNLATLANVDLSKLS